MTGMVLQVPRSDKNESQINDITVAARVETEVEGDPRITTHPNVTLFFDQDNMAAFHGRLKTAIAEYDSAKYAAEVKAQAQVKAETDAKVRAQQEAQRSALEQTKAEAAAQESERSRREDQLRLLNQRAEVLGGKAVEVTVGGKPSYIFKLRAKEAPAVRQFIKDLVVRMPWMSIEKHFLVFASADTASELVEAEWKLRPKNMGGSKEGSRVYELKSAPPDDVYIIVPADEGISDMGRQFDGTKQAFMPHLQELGMPKPKGGRFVEATVLPPVTAAPNAPAVELAKAATPAAVPPPESPTPAVAPAAPPPAAAAPTGDYGAFKPRPISGLSLVNTTDSKTLFDLDGKSTAIYEGHVSAGDITRPANLEGRIQKVVQAVKDLGMERLFVIYRSQTGIAQHITVFKNIATRVCGKPDVTLNFNQREATLGVLNPNDEVFFILVKGPVDNGKVLQKFDSFLFGKIGSH